MGDVSVPSGRFPGAVCPSDGSLQNHKRANSADGQSLNLSAQFKTLFFWHVRNKYIPCPTVSTVYARNKRFLRIKKISRTRGHGRNVIRFETRDRTGLCLRLAIAIKASTEQGLLFLRAIFDNCKTITFDRLYKCRYERKNWNLKLSPAVKFCCLNFQKTLSMVT